MLGLPKFGVLAGTAVAIFVSGQISLSRFVRSYHRP